MLGTIQIKLNITGRVQGVFFRVKTKKTADKLGILGYVKNLADGSVEAMIQGNPSIIEQMIQWCNQGPSASQVDKVTTENIQQAEKQNNEREFEQYLNFDNFEIRY
jgi:acylphosphatase